MKRDFLAGLIALLPIGLTIFVIWFVVNSLGGVLKVVFQKIPIFTNLNPFLLSLMGFITLLILIYLVGFVTRIYLGRKLLQLFDRIMTKLPVIQTIYNAGKKLSDGIFIDKSAFQKVVLVEFPKPGSYAIGFLTSKDTFQIRDKTDNESVYIPIPNGFYLAVSKTDVIETNLTVDKALQIIISGGIISPTGQLAKENDGK